MRIIVGCEFSQIVTKAFRDRGHEAYSCDLLPTEGNPDWHFQEDIFEVLKREKQFDLGIFHPPCTYLCRHRARWNEPKDDEHREAGNEFFMKLLNAPIEKICIENPVPLRKSNLPQYSQIIQPWQFGHDYSKRTCLWLKNLQPLEHTNVVQITYYTTPKGRTFTRGWYFTPRNGKDRSRTFTGIAEAMATQWGTESHILSGTR